MSASSVASKTGSSSHGLVARNTGSNSHGHAATKRPPICQAAASSHSYKERTELKYALARVCSEASQRKKLQGRRLEQGAGGATTRQIPASAANPQGRKEGAERG
eukprot:354028-Chlamydomonas_euryale.AAC.16